MVSMVTTLPLVAMRMSMLFLFPPVPALRFIPVIVRVLLLWVASIFFVNLVKPLPFSGSASIFFLILFLEGVNSFLLHTSVALPFAICSMAGQWIDTQVGLQGLGILMPNEPAYPSLVSQFFLLLATYCFFSSYAHHALLFLLQHSFASVPLGKTMFHVGILKFLQEFVWMGSMTLLLAFPLVFVFLLLDVLGALSLRSMPASQPYFLLLPLKILLSLYLLKLALPTIIPRIEACIREGALHMQEGLV